MSPHKIYRNVALLTMFGLTGFLASGREFEVTWLGFAAGCGAAFLVMLLTDLWELHKP